MNTDEKVFLTQGALEEFKKEYVLLTQTRRPHALERVAETRVLGEMEESTDHIQAKEDLAFVDGRITELEEIIGKAVLIDDGHKNCTNVQVGCRVTVDSKSGQKVFHLVGEWEADPTNKKISHESPLGQALMGKKIGDQVEVDAPAGKLVYMIVEID